MWLSRHIVAVVPDMYSTPIWLDLPPRTRFCDPMELCPECLVPGSYVAVFPGVPERRCHIRTPTSGGSDDQSPKMTAVSDGVSENTVTYDAAAGRSRHDLFIIKTSRAAGIGVGRTGRGPTYSLGIQCEHAEFRSLP